MLDFGWFSLLRQSKTETLTGMYIYVSICRVGEGGNLHFASHVRYSTTCVSVQSNSTPTFPLSVPCLIFSLCWIQNEVLRELQVVQEILLCLRGWGSQSGQMDRRPRNRPLSIISLCLTQLLFFHSVHQSVLSSSTGQGQFLCSNSFLILTTK